MPLTARSFYVSEYVANRVVNVLSHNPLPDGVSLRIVLVAEDPIMAESSLMLTGEERDYLVQVLETQLKNTLVEEHRTRTPSYRQFVLEDESVIQGLLAKLCAHQSPTAPSA
jgi:hypothetical protein